MWRVRFGQPRKVHDEMRAWSVASKGLSGELRGLGDTSQHILHHKMTMTAMGWGRSPRTKRVVHRSAATRQSEPTMLWHTYGAFVRAQIHIMIQIAHTI